MLDVHAPEHPVHGIRDFLIHLLTITVGLLIALGLENIAEWRHHVHLRNEAVANMRLEIEANRKDLGGVLEAIPREQARMRLMAAALQERAAGKQGDLRTGQWGVLQTTLHDASWNTAGATGALAYMEYGEVQRFASAYQFQKKFEGLESQALPPIVSLGAAITVGDPAQMTAADATATLGSVRLIVGNLETLRGMGHDLDGMYAEALKNE